jgi:hypothetical protein
MSKQTRVVGLNLMVQGRGKNIEGGRESKRRREGGGGIRQRHLGESREHSAPPSREFAANGATGYSSKDAGNKGKMIVANASQALKYSNKKRRNEQIRQKKQRELSFQEKANNGNQKTHVPGRIDSGRMMKTRIRLLK